MPDPTFIQPSLGERVTVPVDRQPGQYVAARVVGYLGYLVGVKVGASQTTCYFPADMLTRS
jgi:hypothetical protein